MGRGVFSALIGLMIALLPFYNRFAVVDFSRTSKDNLALIFFIASAAFLGVNNRKVSLAIKVTALYLFAVTALNHHNLISVNVIIHSFYIVGGLLFFLSCYKSLLIEDSKPILTGMAFGAIVQSLLVMGDMAGMAPFTKAMLFFRSDLGATNIIKHPMGSLGNSNLVSSYIALTSMAFLLLKRKWFLVIPAIALYLTDSEMGQAAFVGGLAYYYLSTKTKLVWIMYPLSAAGMIATYLIGVGGRDHGRFGVWEEVVKRLWINGDLLLGAGPGWFADQKIFSSETEMAVQEHSEFIAALDNFGLIGIILILTPFILKKGRFGPWGVVLFVGYLNMFGHFNLHQSTTAIIILVSMAMCLNYEVENVGNMERKRPTN